MSIVKLCPYDLYGEHCKYEKYYGEPIFSKCKDCERNKKNYINKTILMGKTKNPIQSLI